MGILSNTLWAKNHIINNWVASILGGSNINLNEYNIYQSFQRAYAKETQTKKEPKVGDVTVMVVGNWKLEVSPRLCQNESSVFFFFFPEIASYGLFYLPLLWALLIAQSNHCYLF